MNSSLCLICWVFRTWPALLVITACASVGGVQTANTVGKGNLQIGVEPGVQVLGGTPGLQLYPHLDAAARYGFTDRVDLGLRAGWSFLEAQAKWLLTEPNSPRVTISFAPTVGGVVLTQNVSSPTDALGGILSGATPVLFGFNLGAHQLVVGLRTQHFVYLSGTSPAPTYLLAVGGSLGFAIRFSDTMRLLPELASVWPVWGGLAVTRTDGVHADYLYGARGIGIFQFKLGFLLDRRQ